MFRTCFPSKYRIKCAKKFRKKTFKVVSENENDITLNKFGQVLNLIMYVENEFFYYVVNKPNVYETIREPFEEKFVN